MTADQATSALVQSSSLSPASNDSMRPHSLAMCSPTCSLFVMLIMQHHFRCKSKYIFFALQQHSGVHISFVLCRKERMDRIKRLRWQQRSLPEDTKQNLSQSEIEVRCFPAKLRKLEETVFHWLEGC